MSFERAVLIALDSVGIDPLGHDRPESVYAGSRFLFPRRGGAGWPLGLPDAPVEGALTATDVTGGREEGSIECAITYASIFSGEDALAAHGLMEGLGTRDELLEALVARGNLFARFRRPCLANALFPAHLPFLRGSYVEDLLPARTREQVASGLTFEGAPVRLSGPDKRGLAELFTAAEINQNVFVHAAREAGVRLRTWDDVRRGQALTGSLTHGLENALDPGFFGEAPLPARTPEEAGAVLEGLSGEHDLVFYKFQLADLISHTGRLELAREVFATIEAFLGAFLARVDPARTLVVVTSDHGHLEQVTFTQGHPKTLVPTWVFGAGAGDLARGLTTPPAIYGLLTEQVATTEAASG